MGIQSINDNVGRHKTPAEVDRIADKICEMTGSTDARAFYCKAAYKLSENKMCVRAEIAIKGREPAKYLLGLYLRNRYCPV